MLINLLKQLLITILLLQAGVLYYERIMVTKNSLPLWLPVATFVGYLLVMSLERPVRPNEIPTINAKRRTRLIAGLIVLSLVALYIAWRSL